MARKHVLITGGASGLGLGCAERFRKLGWDVTLADVDRQAGAAAVARLQALSAGAEAARFEPVDLADPASVQALAGRLLARGEPIHVLVNNAGIYPPSRRTLSSEGHELTFAIAHFGHFRLTHAVWPLLQSADAARVVSVTSLVQRWAALDLDDLTLAQRYEPYAAYRQAKLACLLFALELQRRLDAARSRLASYAAHPGVCRTRLGRNRPRSERDRWWQRLSTAVLGWGLGHVGQSPENGAAPVVIAATSGLIPRGAFVGPTGVLEIAGTPGLVRPGAAASDRGLAAALWERTEALTGIRWTP